MSFSSSRTDFCLFDVSCFHWIHFKNLFQNLFKPVRFILVVYQNIHENEQYESICLFEVSRWYHKRFLLSSKVTESV